MRSQNRTYATDTAKNAIVTAIQRTSCMGYLLDCLTRVQTVKLLSARRFVPKLF